MWIKSYDLNACVKSSDLIENAKPVFFNMTPIDSRISNQERLIQTRLPCLHCPARGLQTKHCHLFKQA